jgi:uncharacterized protein YdcH (DUF465 family)
MTARIYRLMEFHQRIDERLRHELRKRRPDWLEATRLRKMKLRVKDLLHRMRQTPSFG